jgi:type I restriction enzyme S subunit
MLNNFEIPFPPKQEQIDIVDAVWIELNKIDTLSKEVNHSIDLLKEHRSALISAAVTGKIDVRDQYTTQGN